MVGVALIGDFRLSAGQCCRGRQEILGKWSISNGYGAGNCARTHRSFSAGTSHGLFILGDNCSRLLSQSPAPTETGLLKHLPLPATREKEKSFRTFSSGQNGKKQSTPLCPLVSI
jgi:hypothetical protein